MAVVLSLIGLTGNAFGQITVTGFYGTGYKSTGATMTQGTYTDGAWNVVGAKTNGATDTADGRGDYLGLAYEVGTSYLPSGWVTALGGGAWITTHKNAGGDPNVLGYGTSFAANGSGYYQAAAYVYELSFTISGGTTGQSINNSLFAINFTLAADDTYAVFVNQSASSILSGSVFTGNGTLASSAAGSVSSTYYGSTTNVSIRSSSSASTGFGNWQYGTNTIDILVMNTNNVSGASSSATANPSGLLVYGFYAVTPEPQTYIQAGALLGVVGLLRIRRRRG